LLRWVPIFILFALFVQGASLRACDLEKVALGSNCHERPEGACSDGSDQPPTDHHSVPDEGHCVCDIAKPTATRAVGGNADDALLTAVWFVDVIALILPSKVPIGLADHSIPDPPDWPSESYHLPLLF
jgi:predicted metal-binding membrane protein